MANAESASFENQVQPDAWREARETVLNDSRQARRRLIADLAPGVDAQEAFSEAEQRGALARLVERYGSPEIKASGLGKVLKSPSFVGMAGFMLQDAIQSIKEIRDLPKLKRNIDGIRRMLDRTRQTASDEATRHEVRMGEEYLSQLSLLCFGKQASTLAFAADAAGDAVEMAHGGLQMASGGTKGLGKAGEFISKLEGSLKFGSKLKLSVPFLYAGATVVQNIAIAQSGRVERQKIEQVQEYVRSYMEKYLDPDERREFAQAILDHKDEMFAMKDAEMASTLVFFVVTCLNPWVGIGVGLGAGAVMAPQKEAEAWLYELPPQNADEKGLAAYEVALASALKLHEGQAEDYLWRWSTEYEKTPLSKKHIAELPHDPANNFALTPEGKRRQFSTEYVGLLWKGRQSVIRASLINGYRTWCKETKKEGTRDEMRRYVEAGMGWFRDNRGDYRAKSREDARECLGLANVRAKETFATAKTLGNLHGLGFDLEKEIDSHTRIYRWGNYRIQVSFRDGNSWTKPDWTAIDAAGKPIPTPAETRGQIEEGLESVWLRLKYDGVKLRIRKETPGMKDIYPNEFRYSEWKTRQNGFWNIVRFGEVGGEIKAFKYYIDRSMPKIMEYGSVEGIPFSRSLFINSVDDSGNRKTNAALVKEIKEAVQARTSQPPTILESPTHVDAYFRIGSETYRAWFAKDSEARGIEHFGSVDDLTLSANLPLVVSQRLNRPKTTVKPRTMKDRTQRVNELPGDRQRRIDGEIRDGRRLFNNENRPFHDGPQLLGRP